MPVITIPTAAMTKAKELARQVANASPAMKDWYTAECGGFFEGLRCCLPSEAVGMVVMEHDDWLEEFRKQNDNQKENETCS